MSNDDDDDNNNNEDFDLNNYDGMPRVFNINNMPPSLRQAMANSMMSGGMTIMQTGSDGKMSSFTLGADGSTKPAGSDTPCEPGSEFTQYVKEHLVAFPYNPSMPSSTTRTNLWPGRKLLMKLDNNKGRDDDLPPAWQAKVVEWEEWNTGPFCPVTKWNLTVQMIGPTIGDNNNNQQKKEGLDKGDLVVAHGLKSAKGKSLNGSIGSILAFVKDTGRYAVGLETEEDGCVKKQLKSENIRFFKGEITFECGIV